MKKRIYSIPAVAFLVLVAGCGDFGDTNVNPNASETPVTSALLTNAQTALGGSTTQGANFVAGLYAQYFSETQYTDNSLYSNQDVDWAGELAGSIYDLQNIININTDPLTAPTAALDGSNNNQIAIARILKAYRFSVLTDRYGDMPYFEALQGNTQPIVDSQQAIYTDLFSELSAAVAQFDNLAAVKGDIMYGGDNAKWKKFANSLRIILALRVSEVDPVLGETQVDDVINNLGTNGGVFASNDDNAVLDYPGGSFNNPWFGIGADQGVSELVADLLNATQDLRRNEYGKPSSGTLIGVPYGMVREDAIAWTAANSGWSLILNDDYRAQASRIHILTYADVLLARAQAALPTTQYGWTAEDPVTLYNAAVQASWEQWGVFSAGAFTTYITNPANAIGAGPTPGAPLGDDDNEKIATMRWLTFYPNGPQGWSEWRRTGIPALVPTPFAVNTSGQIPNRFPFPSVEYNYNGVKLADAVARMGSDTDQTKVWWDAN